MTRRLALCEAHDPKPPRHRSCDKQILRIIICIIWNSNAGSINKLLYCGPPSHLEFLVVNTGTRTQQIQRQHLGYMQTGKNEQVLGLGWPISREPGEK